MTVRDSRNISRYPIIHAKLVGFVKRLETLHSIILASENIESSHMTESFDELNKLICLANRLDENVASSDKIG